MLTARNESAAFHVDKDGEGFRAAEIWRGNNLKGNFAMPVVHDGYIYGYDADFLASVDAASGERMWKTRSDAAGLILVDGHLVIFDSEGDVVIAAASSEGYEELASIDVAEEGGFTSPSFSEGGIYVRTMEKMARVDVKSR